MVYITPLVHIIHFMSSTHEENILLTLRVASMEGAYSPFKSIAMVGVNSSL